MKGKALLVALATAIVGAGALVVYRTRFEREASGGVPVDVVVALADLSLGATINRSVIGSRRIPSGYLESGRHIRWAEHERILGVRVTSGVRAAESVLWSDLATTSSDSRDLSSMVGPGMRAVSIRADATATFGGLVRPGDRVDLLVTYSGAGGATVGRVSATTIPLLQNILVLAVGRDTGGTGAASESERNRSSGGTQVVVSATAEQAQLLTFAGEFGRMTLVLRNPDDIETLERLPPTTPDDVLSEERRRQFQGTRPGGSGAAPNNNGAQGAGFVDIIRN